MAQLKALTSLHDGWNELPSTDVDFIIESFPQLTELDLSDLGLTGEHLCRTSGTLNFCLHRVALHNRQSEGSREALGEEQQVGGYVLLYSQCNA